MLIDLVKKNRSYRSFNPERNISRDELLSLVDVARHAPSAINLQPIKYIISSSDEREQNEKILSCCRFAGFLKDKKLPPKGHEPAAYIIMLLDNEITQNHTSAYRDIGIAEQTIMLAAAEAGLGGCIVGAFDKELLQGLLEIPERYTPCQVLVLGEPDEQVVLEDLSCGQSSEYYRDENNIHHVPKRKLEDIVL